MAYGAASINVTDAVKARLKSPSTAKFVQWFYDFKEQKEGEYAGHWWTRGEVDSQNGFGAIVRSEFIAIVDIDGNLIHLVIEQR